MDRRGFLKTLIGGVAAATAVREFPFRVFSFPTEVAKPVALTDVLAGFANIKPEFAVKISDFSEQYMKPAMSELGTAIDQAVVQMLSHGTGNLFFTSEMTTKEALSTLEHNLKFMGHTRRDSDAAGVGSTLRIRKPQRFSAPLDDDAIRYSFLTKEERDKKFPPQSSIEQVVETAGNQLESFADGTEKIVNALGKLG